MYLNINVSYNLEESFHFYGREPITLFNPGVALEERAGSNTSRDPFDGNHFTFTCNKGSLAMLTYKVTLDSCKKVYGVRK